MVVSTGVSQPEGHGFDGPGMRSQVNLVSPLHSKAQIVSKIHCSHSQS